MNMKRIAIIGTGNIGASIAKGLKKSERFFAKDIILTRRRLHLLDSLKEEGFVVEKDNCQAVRNAQVVIIAVEPQQINNVMREIAPALKADLHILISVVTGVTINQIVKKIGKDMVVVLAMPNIAIAVCESMTCISSNRTGEPLEVAESIFATVGKTMIITDEEMIAATALGACGIAFFMRAIRAASQGGIEVGFRAEDALSVAAQTAKGAASLLLSMGNHPEFEIDKVTTPRGCTIAGLNQMEHEGFSSAWIRGITVSAQKALELYQEVPE